MTTPETVRRIVGPTILLYSGRYFDFDDPEGSLFDIGDIARGLSHICRFGGQCPRFYSVAEHSVYVSMVVAAEHALAGLMHDAAEAFVGDMPKPLKVMCPDYVAIEKRIERAVLDRFGISMPLDPSIKEADIRMLATEQSQLMANRDDWDYTRGRPVVDGLTIVGLAPNDAFNLFIDRFETLTGQAVDIDRLAT
jgi:5'-deoxynucleotidase YfbR-like HD superfamily hydrolase